MRRGWLSKSGRCRNMRFGDRRRWWSVRITALLFFIREARDKIESVNVTLIEKEIIIDKLRIMCLPPKVILESLVNEKTVKKRNWCVGN